MSKRGFNKADRNVASCLDADFPRQQDENKTCDPNEAQVDCPLCGRCYRVVSRQWPHARICLALDILADEYG
jgi:hypothetical protein